MRKGYSLAEMLVVMAIISILAIVSTVNMVGRRNYSHLTSTASTMAAMLREAQSRSVSQSLETSWGVHFENSTNTTPFFAMFSGSYSPSSHVQYYPLPAWLGYATSSVNLGSYAQVSFSQLSGSAVGSSSISIYLIQSSPEVSSTITIAPSGAVSY